MHRLVNIKYLNKELLLIKCVMDSMQRLFIIPIKIELTNYQEVVQTFAVYFAIVR